MIRSLSLRPRLVAGLSAAATAVAAFTLVPTEAAATPPGGTRRYEVEITNATRGQIFGPIAIATHSAKTAIFEIGAPASPGLGYLAEEGNPMMFMAELGANPDVLDVRATGGPLLPGQTTTMQVVVDAAHPYVSLASMLVVTNDAFVGLRGLRVPLEGSQTTYAFAYDSGTEANSELCAFIPGPPCGSAGAHDPAPGEGFVHVHRGVHGVGDISAAEYDWRGPVAMISVRLVQP